MRDLAAADDFLSGPRMRLHPLMQARDMRAFINSLANGSINLYLDQPGLFRVNCELTPQHLLLNTLEGVSREWVHRVAFVKDSLSGYELLLKYWRIGPSIPRPGHRSLDQIFR